jgi:hypothetical protein
LEEAQRSDLRLLEMCREAPLLPGVQQGSATQPYRFGAVRPLGQRKKGEAAVALVHGGVPGPVSIDTIVDGLAKDGFSPAPDREVAKRNTIWLLRNEVRTKNAPIRDLGKGQSWIWFTPNGVTVKDVTEAQAVT